MKISELDLLTKQRREARRNLLRNPPRFANPDSKRKAAIILAELNLIQRSSNHTGAVKHELFARGCKQLDELPK